MNCDHDALAEYVAHKLDAGRVADLAVHVAGCGDCSVALAQLRRSAAVLGDASLIASAEATAWLQRFSQTLISEDAAAESLVPELLRHSPDRWRAVIAADERLRRAAVVRKLIELTKGAYRTLPSRALELATLAVDISELLPDSEEAWRVRARAYRKQSSAFMNLGRFPEAMQVLDVAESCIGHWPDANLQAARLKYARANVFAQIGRHLEAKSLLSSAAATFRRFGATTLLGEAKFLKAYIAQAEGSYEVAARVFLNVVDVMHKLGNVELEAMARLNCAGSLLKMGKKSEALEMLARASVMINRGGMEAEKVSVRWLIASTQCEAGDLEVGLPALRQVEADYNVIGKASDSIHVGLEIAEWLLTCDDDQTEEIVSRLCSLVPRASAARMSAECAIALTHLRRLAEAGDLTVDSVRHVRQFLEDVNHYPNMTFRPLRG